MFLDNKVHWVSRNSHQYATASWFLLRKFAMHCTHVELSHRWQNLSTWEWVSIYMNFYIILFTLFSGGIKYKESVWVYTGKPKLLIVLELKFYDDKYLWTLGLFHGQTLPSLFLQILTNYFPISPFLCTHLLVSFFFFIYSCHINIFCI